MLFNLQLKKWLTFCNWYEYNKISILYWPTLPIFASLFALPSFMTARYGPEVYLKPLNKWFENQSNPRQLNFNLFFIFLFTFYNVFRPRLGHHQVIFLKKENFESFLKNVCNQHKNRLKNAPWTEKQRNSTQKTN